MHKTRYWCHGLIRFLGGGSLFYRIYGLIRLSLNFKLNSPPQLLSDNGKGLSERRGYSIFVSAVCMPSDNANQDEPSENTYDMGLSLVRR